MELRSVLLIHSDEIGWGDLRALLRSIPGLAIAGEAGDREQALRLAASHRPEVIFIGETVEGTCAASLVAALRRGPCPDSTVIVLARRVDPDNLREWTSQQVSVSAYLLWSELSRGLLERCLTVALSGEIMVISQVVARATVSLLQGEARLAGAARRLTPRERALLPWLARWELSYAQIGAQLGIDADTVKVHVRRIGEKLGTRGGRAAVVDAARALGLLPATGQGGEQGGW